MKNNTNKKNTHTKKATSIRGFIAEAMKHGEVTRSGAVRFGHSRPD